MGGKRPIGSKMSISEMPDEILCFILSLMPMREAARTSILSWGWRDLWKTSLVLSSCLNLDVVNWRGSEYSNNMFGECDQPEYRENSSLLSTESVKFVEWVNQILQLNYSPVIDSFRLRYYLKKEFALHIDQWINMAISKGVRNLDIDLSHFHSWGSYYSHEEPYAFPYWLFTQETGSLVKSLCLNSCILGPLDLNNFSSLVDLRLEQVLINQNTFLFNCPNLENLCLIKCSKMYTLEISGQSLKLKHLVVAQCSSLRKIKIDAKNLTSFEYWGPFVNFFFPSVPQLSDVIVSLDRANLSALSATLSYVLRKLARHLAKLESLMLLVSSIKESIIPRKCANLKKLVLMIDTLDGNPWDFIPMLRPLLHASPNLHTLELHWLLFFFTKCEEGTIPKPSDLLHLHLKKIVLTGFTGTTHEIEFATYLLNSTTTLKKMIIGYDCKCYNYKMGFRKSAENAPKKKNMIEQTSKQLMKVLPPGVELLFL